MELNISITPFWPSLLRNDGQNRKQSTALCALRRQRQKQEGTSMKTTFLKKVQFIILALSLVLMCLSGKAMASIGPLEGIVLCLAIDPNDTDTIYAGTYGGGIFKTTDGGENWSEVNVGITNRYINALAIDPKNSKTVYAGTGGAGVFKSTDGGETWSLLSARLSGGIWSIAIDPTETNRLHVAAQGGLYRSTDGGENWAVYSAFAITSVAIAPTDSNTLYAGGGAGCVPIVGCSGDLIKSTNKGETWSRVAAFSTNAIAIDPKNSNTVYAGTTDRLFIGSVFKSTNGGERWSQVRSWLPVVALAIDPKNSNTIYAGTGGFYSTGVVYRSQNGGQSWSAVNLGPTNTYVRSLAIDPEGSNTIYVGTSNGIFVSYDGGETWSSQNVSLRHPDIPNGDFEALGDNGLPAHWQTVWHNSGSGSAVQYDSGGADAFQGNSVLRLHVDPGGGSTFVLSDAIPVAPGATYLISSRMRFNLASDLDAVFFSIVQSDNEGHAVGFDEVRGRKGENFWTWRPRRILIRTSPGTTSIRIRFGLVSADESYLDVDAVR
jgi:photosystem II stability/assembly factor-like uncharacterized protein